VAVADHEHACRAVDRPGDRATEVPSQAEGLALSMGPFADGAAYRNRTDDLRITSWFEGVIRGGGE
jgi:hypothetical protein